MRVEKVLCPEHEGQYVFDIIKYNSVFVMAVGVYEIVVS